VVEAPRHDAPREAPTAAAPNVRVIEGVTPVIPPDQPTGVPETGY
jgi:hypothetical protein